MKPITLLFFLSVLFGAPDKYALALYHFNLQYVAGSHEIEKRIIEESIIPLFDFYESHPSYKGDFEIQAGHWKSWNRDIQKIERNIIKLSLSVRPNKDRLAEIRFPLRGKKHFYSPPMGEDALIKIPKDLKNDPILSLTNGLLTLGNGWNLIKDNFIEHLDGTWKYESNTLVFPGRTPQRYS